MRNSLRVNASLREALNPEDTQDWCAYPVAQFFECRIPNDMELSMSLVNQTCVVECMLEHPYDTEFGKLYILHIIISKLNTKSYYNQPVNYDFKSKTVSWLKVNVDK